MPHKECLVIVFDAPIKVKKIKTISGGAKSFELEHQKTAPGNKPKRKNKTGWLELNGLDSYSLFLAMKVKKDNVI